MRQQRSAGFQRRDTGTQIGQILITDLHDVGVRAHPLHSADVARSRLAMTRGRQLMSTITAHSAGRSSSIVSIVSAIGSNTSPRPPVKSHDGFRSSSLVVYDGADVPST